mmetsp:Transcript_13013/g.28169  ORF Transcript_13013/g.28169 Transcript_13013/m.28169 type:complete len:115 (+) Transcript_13013:314-658(+)
MLPLKKTLKKLLLNGHLDLAHKFESMFFESVRSQLPGQTPQCWIRLMTGRVSRMVERKSLGFIDTDAGTVFFHIHDFQDFGMCPFKLMENNVLFYLIVDTSLSEKRQSFKLLHP